MEDFISFVKKLRGFGQPIKRAMRKWITESTNEYYALKYRKQIADAIRLSRFKGDDPIYKFILSHYDNVKGLDEKETAKALKAVNKKYPKLKAYEQACEAIASGDADKVSGLITEFKLDVNSLLGVGKIDDKVWSAFAEVMPVMQFVKLLDKLDRSGVFNDKKKAKALVESKITVENLKKARVFPFRLYTAYEHITNDMVKNRLADVLNDYAKEYDWDVFNKFSWAICPDVSGSMQGKVNGSELTPATISGMFTGFFIKGLDDVKIIPWDTAVHIYNRPKADSVLTHIDTIKAFGGGGTYMNLGPEYLLAKKIKVDYSVFITDAEQYGRPWLDAWAKYKAFNPKAKAFLIRVDGYSTQPFDSETAEKYGVRQIFGWSDNVVKYVEYSLEQDLKKSKKSK